MRQNVTTVRESSSPAARANASSCGVGFKGRRRTLSPCLVFDVLLDDGKGRPSHGGDEVAVDPPGRQATLQPRELLPMPAGGPAFDQPYQAVDTKLRVDRAQEMPVIRHDLPLDPLRSPFGRDVADDGLQPDIHATDQYPASIRRAPDDMALTGVPDVAMRTKWSAHRTIRPHTPI